MAQPPVPGKDGNKYVPYGERTGNESIVYFTRDLSAEGLIKAYEQVNAHIEGKTGVKLHTGEQHGPNIIPHEWVKALMQKDLPDASIVETYGNDTTRVALLHIEGDDFHEECYYLIAEPK